MALTKISRGLLSTGVSDSSDATAITIDSSERVGIGTSSPDRNLTVFASNPVLNIKNSTANLHLEQNGHNGYVGNNSSSGFIQIFTNNGNSTSQFNADGSFQIGAASIANLKFSSSGDVISVTAKKDGTDDIDLAFHTQDSGGTTGERMRILANGGIFMQKTGHAFATVGNEFFDTGKSNHTVSGDTVMNLHRTGSHGTILEFFKDSGSVGSISTNANSLPSDKNFKRDISDLDLGLNLITKLKPSQYNYKLDDEDCPKMYGLIAQDLEKSLTEVGVEKNSTWLLQHNPKDDEKQSDYALDYLKLTPVLIKAIQEQQDIIEDLKSRIKTLEG